MSSVTKSLSQFSDDQLFEEIVRRRNADDAGSRGDIKFCEDCEHFVPYEEQGEVPKRYNPCRFGHDLQFREPIGYDFISWGFFRRVCDDRLEKEEA